MVGWLEDVVKLLHPLKPGATVNSGGAVLRRSTTCRARVVRLFAMARRTADVCVFTITDDRIAEAIMSAHKPRRAGVDHQRQ